MDLLRIIWRDGSGGVTERGLQDMQGVLLQRPGIGNIKRWLLMKENQTSQAKEFSAFLHMRRFALWAHGSHSFALRLGSLGPASICPPATPTGQS